MLSRSSILFRHSRGLSAPLGVNSVPRRFAGAGFVIRPPRGFLEQLDDAPVAPEGSDDATANATGGAEAGQDRQEFLVRGLYRRYVAINQKCGAHPHPHLRPVSQLNTPHLSDFHFLS